MIALLATVAVLLALAAVAAAMLLWVLDLLAEDRDEDAW